MTFNAKLFHLGNDVVRLEKKFEHTFPKSCASGKNELGDCFMDLLELLNAIRLAIQDVCEDPQWWDVKVKCNTQQLLAIKEQIEVLELNYEINKSESKVEE